MGWIKGRGISGEYGFINTKTGEFRTTLPNSVQEKKQEISKQRKAALRMHSARQAKFEEGDGKRRNHSDETIKKTINIPIITMNPNRTFSNNYINSLAPAESSLSTEDPITEFYIGNKILIPAFTAITRGVKYGLGRYGSGQLQNWARNRVVNRELNRAFDKSFKSNLPVHTDSKIIDITPKTSISLEEVNKPFTGKLTKYLTESGESTVYDGGSYVIKEKNLYDVNSSLLKLHHNVSRDLSMNNIPGIEPIEYLGYKVNTNPQRVIDGLTGKIRVNLNKTYDPIYRQKKLTTLDDVWFLPNKPTPYQLLDKYHIKHDLDFGYVDNIKFSDFGLKNWGIDNYGNYRIFDPMIKDF